MIIFLKAGTPETAALKGTKWVLVILAIILAKVVFPEPGGPQRIIDWSLSSSIALRKGFPGPIIFSCPKKSSNFSGLILSARGALLNLFFSKLSKSSIKNYLNHILFNFIIFPSILEILFKESIEYIVSSIELKKRKKR